MKTNNLKIEMHLVEKNSLCKLLILIFAFLPGIEGLIGFFIFFFWQKTDFLVIFVSQNFEPLNPNWVLNFLVLLRTYVNDDDDIYIYIL